MGKSTAKTVVEQVFSVRTLDEMWTANYPPVLPFTPQNYAIDAILPTILYMFRWGHRRGKGSFQKTFLDKQNSKKIVAIEDVAKFLIQNDTRFMGFDSEIEEALLGDLLLTYCLENKNKATGRREQVQRVFPTHYYASWIDLPESLAHLCYIPEMIVSLLANQKEGEKIERGKATSRFPVGIDNFESNLLLHILSPGTRITGRSSELGSDCFDENQTDVGIDQLLTIRMAQACKKAPENFKGKGENPTIPNRRPLAGKATDCFTDDFNVFIQAYGRQIPRKTLLSMVESCFSLGTATILFSSIILLNKWEESGEVTDLKEQQPLPVYTDCSSGMDRDLQETAEQSMSEIVRQFDRMPVVMMMMRVLEQKANYDTVVRKEKDKIPVAPNAQQWINLLGEIYKGKHERAGKILETLDEDCLKLADALEAEEEGQAVNEILRDTNGNPATRLAEALCLLMGDISQRRHFIKALDSCLMVNQTNGLGRKRKRQRYRKTVEMRSIVLSNMMLDYLVHRHLRKSGKGKKAKPLTFPDFISILRERYGLYVDQSPAGMDIPVELLLRNRRFLERRLRDMGLLVGVNDAESMKRLKQRFEAEGDNNDE